MSNSTQQGHSRCRMEKRKGKPRSNWIEEQNIDVWIILKQEFEGEEGMEEDVPNIKSEVHMKEVRKRAEKRLL